MNDAQNTNLRGVRAIENDVVANGETPDVGPLGPFEALANEREPGKQCKLVVTAETIRVALSSLPLSLAK